MPPAKERDNLIRAESSVGPERHDLEMLMRLYGQTTTLIAREARVPASRFRRRTHTRGQAISPAQRAARNSRTGRISTFSGARDMA